MDRAVYKAYARIFKQTQQVGLQCLPVSSKLKRHLTPCCRQSDVFQRDERSK